MRLCDVVGMTFHHDPIAPRTSKVAITTIIKGSTRLLFPNSTTTKMKDMENQIVLWHDKDIVVCK
jgi:hypothetical protein